MKGSRPLHIFVPSPLFVRVRPPDGPGRAKRGLRNPQRRHVRREDAAQVAASAIIFLLAPTSASPGWGSGSAGPFGPSSNLQPRKRGLRPAVTGGDRKMMWLEKMKISFFRLGAALIFHCADREAWIARTHERSPRFFCAFWLTKNSPFRQLYRPQKSHIIALICRGFVKGPGCVIMVE